MEENSRFPDWRKWSCWMTSVSSWRGTYNTFHSDIALHMHRKPRQIAFQPYNIPGAPVLSGGRTKLPISILSHTKNFPLPVLDSVPLFNRWTDNAIPAPPSLFSPLCPMICSRVFTLMWISRGLPTVWQTDWQWVRWTTSWRMTAYLHLVVRKQISTGDACSLSKDDDGPYKHLSSFAGWS